MNDFAVLVPVLGRPQRAQPVADSLAGASTLGCRLVFVCSPDDGKQIEACRQTGADVLVVPWEPGRADWARKLNHAYRRTTEPLLLLAADDVSFERRWDLEAAAVFAHHDVGVVGTNDLANPSVKRGHHSCHPVVGRGYADLHGTIDGPGALVAECYWHQWVDSELVATARARGCWAFAPGSVVRHHHPLFDRRVVLDDTYRRGSGLPRAEALEERRLFEERTRGLRAVVAGAYSGDAR